MAAPKKPDSTRPVPVVTGPTRIVVPEAKEVTKPVRAVTAQTAQTQTSVTKGFVTADPAARDLLQAQKWRLLKRRREAAVAKLQEEDAQRVRSLRFRRAAIAILVLGTVSYVWRLIDLQHGNRWPLFDVWILMCVALLGCLGFMVWYIDWKK